jgi:hypothetical protein
MEGRLHGWRRRALAGLALGAAATLIAASTGRTAGLDVLPPAGTPLLTDTSADSNPRGIWGSIECQNDGRHQRPVLDGEPRLAVDGQPLGTTAHRRLTVFDGDDFSGERCELGLNDWETGPTALYHEGERRITYVSLRLPQSFPLEANAWQTVTQMKQAQPSDAGGGPPVVELSAYSGQWVLSVSTGDTADDWTRWTASASRNVWTRFALDVVYSQNPAIGSVKLYADLNGDGDSTDPGEQSAVEHGTTLKRETAEVGPPDGITEGESIPSHLRVGIYHNASIPCPGGCSIDVDSVQVVAPQ